MTTRPYTPCKRPACSAITRNKNRYCDACQDYAKEQKARQQKKKTEAFYGKSIWKKVRGRYARQHPLCEDCEAKGLTVPMYCVDHIVEIKDGGAKLDQSNLRSLCRRCHAAKTEKAGKRRGEGTLQSL